MRKALGLVIFVLMLTGGLVLVGQRVSAQNPTVSPTPLSEIRGDASRTINPSAPNVITSLPMSNPYCAQPDPSVNQCAINIRYWQANDNGTGNTLSYVLLTIDGKLRFRSNTFFENFITYSFDMIPNGIKVACGLPNAGGLGALYGNGYLIDVKAYDATNTWVLEDQQQVKCPAFNP